MISQTAVASIVKVIAAGALVAASAGGIYVVASTRGDDAQKQTVTAPSPSVTSSTSGPDATATAIFDATNRKFAAIGRATFPPGTDPIHPYAGRTYPPVPSVTPGPPPTPRPPACSATVAGWSEILRVYGPLPENRVGCMWVHTTIGTQLVFTTVGGVDGGPGAIATYLCETTDARCLSGGPPQAPNAAWTVYPAPWGGGISVQAVGDSSADILVLTGGRCFNLSTHLYDLNPGCH
jgi:hypothetical protein